MAKVFLFNPADAHGSGFTREGRCTQKADTWGTVWPPLSLATAAALLEEDGHQIKLFDFSAKQKKILSLAERVKNFQPDFAIWPTCTTTLSYDLSLAKIVKEASPKTITGVFGTHVTVEPRQALVNTAVDVVIRHEPEGIIQELCRRNSGQWNTVEGISYKESATDGILSNKNKEFLAPENIPPPAWHLLNLDGYRLPLKNRKFLIVAPVRGCPHQCSFCTASVYYGSKPRFRPVEKVVDEIAGNVSRFGIRDYFIWADTFTINSEYVRNFCLEITGRKLSIFWTCNSRVDVLDAKTLQMMKQAGLWMISFGLESANKEILAATGKGINPELSRQAVEMAKKTGIKTAGHFMFGLPGETAATMEQTLNFALSLPLDIAQFYAATPFPGARLYREAAEKGWIKSTTAMSQSKAVMDLPGLPSGEIDSYCRRARRKFYMRPRIAYSILSMIDPWGQLQSILKR